MSQLDAVVDALPDAALGAYLFGSATNGGLRPGSDLDALVVTARRLAFEEKRAFVTRLLAASRKPREVEVTVVAQPDVRPFAHPPRIELQFGEWWRDALERGEEPWPERDSDATILIAMALRSSEALFGPPLHELLDPIPEEDLRRALLDDVPVLLPGLETDTRYSVLTLARIWCTLETGKFPSKSTAADWAIARVPEEYRALLAQGRDDYLHGESADWRDLVPVAKAFAAYVERSVV